MSDKQKLLDILPHCDDCIEEIILDYMRNYSVDFPIGRIADLIEKLQHYVLKPKITKSEEALIAAIERCEYVTRYLNGSLYTDEKAARDHLDVQRANASIALEKCKEAMWG